MKTPLARRMIGFLLAAILPALAGAATLEWTPAEPSTEDLIHFQLLNSPQGGTLHWGVNAKGNVWEPPIEAYVSPGAQRDGTAVRTPFISTDAGQTRTVVLGPFNHPSQAVRSVHFVIQWDDKTWDNNGGQDYRVEVFNRRIQTDPEKPTLNDRVRVLVRDSRSGGLLRWGVNSQGKEWMPPHSNYWPKGTVASDDGLAVDTPISKPDASGVSSVVLGPFNQGAQVVTSLHMAVHWGKAWDTDSGRNYNVPISIAPVPEGPTLNMLEPREGAEAHGTLRVALSTTCTAPVELWLDGALLQTLQAPYEATLDLGAFAYGRHFLTARQTDQGHVAFAQAAFWNLPVFETDTPHPGFPLGAQADSAGKASFALYAPGKKHVSLIGSFNQWDPRAEPMNCSTDGVWWLVRDLPPGTNAFQYLIEGRQRLADPYSTDVEWKDKKGRETHRPEEALSILQSPARPFGWTAQDFKKPASNQWVIYEYSTDDLTHCRGFTGTLERLDYIQDLGFNAIEPLPITEFTGEHSWGYNPSFHFAPESTHGTPDELKHLVDEAHQRGMAFIKDVVFNHMDRASPLFQLYGEDFAASPYFYEFLGENWGFPDLDQESPAFKQYVADALGFWVREYRVDGFRYDATRWVGWQGYNDWGAGWFAYAAKQADPQSLQIAEHLPPDPELIRQTEMDTGWDSDFRWRLREMLNRAELNPPVFTRIMTPSQEGYSHDLHRMVYTESHDEERVMRELLQAGFSREEATRRAETALAITLTAPGIPMIYAGQEFGEDTPKTVGRNLLQWNKLKTASGKKLHQSTRALVRLRTQSPALREGLISLAYPRPQAVVYTRMAGRSSVVVAVNFGRTAQDIEIALPHPGAWRDVLGNATLDSTEALAPKIRLQAGQSAVLVEGE